MTAVEQQERIWQYWLARAYEQLGQQAKAQHIYHNLAKGSITMGYLPKIASDSV